MRRTWQLLLTSMAGTTTSKPGIRYNLLSQAWNKDFCGGASNTNSKTIISALQRSLPLLEDPTSVPFVCRYRTDVIHPLTIPQIHELCDRLQTYKSLESLRNRILEKLSNNDNSNKELRVRVETSFSKSDLEDIYAPLKPPSKGSLEERIRAQHPDLIPKVDAFWDTSANAHQLQPHEAAVTLLSNKIAAHTATTDAVIAYVWKYGRVQTKEADDRDQKYATYHDFSVPLQHIRDHQVLAIKRGVAQKALKLSYDIDGDRAESVIRTSLVDSGVLSSRRHAAGNIWTEAIHDAWTRLLRKRATTRGWKVQGDRAQERAIQVFCDNLQKALLAPPLVPTRPVLALDPGFRAGIKCALLDRNGQLLSQENEKGTTKKETVSTGLATVQFTRDKKQGVQQLVELLERMRNHQTMDASLKEKPDTITVALGNGHGTQEARELIQQASEISKIDIDLQLVNEAGASVWSVTEAANAEFPKEGAAAIASVSIGRRYQNPLPELVKIPPKSLGLGMYQHDLTEKDLDEKLWLTSVNAVADVGVDGNACSLEILVKVPGLTTTLSKRLIKARPLKSRRGDEELDATLVHPESYELARHLLKKLKWDLKDKTSLDLPKLPKTAEARAETWGTLIAKASAKFEVSNERVSTVIDHLIVSVTNPDPRLGGQEDLGASVSGSSTRAGSSGSSTIGSATGCSALPSHFSTSMDALQKSCPLRGIKATVRNVVDFGAFVDFRAERNGLLHRSMLGPVSLDSLLVGQEIGVDILSVASNNRVSVSLTGLNLDPNPPNAQNNGTNRNSGAISKRSFSSSTKSRSNKRKRQN